MSRFIFLLIAGSPRASKLLTFLKILIDFIWPRVIILEFGARKHIGLRDRKKSLFLFLLLLLSFSPEDIYLTKPNRVDNFKDYLTVDFGSKPMKSKGVPHFFDMLTLAIIKKF